MNGSSAAGLTLAFYADLDTGWSDMFKERRDEKAQQAALAVAEQAHSAALVAASQARQVLAYARLEQRKDRVAGILLKPGEFAYLAVEQAGYIEPRRLPGQWAGGSHGVSFRV